MVNWKPLEKGDKHLNSSSYGYTFSFVLNMDMQPFRKENLMGNLPFNRGKLFHCDDGGMGRSRDQERWQISSISWLFAALNCKGFAKRSLTKHLFIRGNQT